VASFHRETVKSLGELLAAAGMNAPHQLRPHHIQRRVGDGRILTLADQFEFMEAGALLGKKPSVSFARLWKLARSEAFGAAV
jgi:hypothetical protein